MKGAQVSSDYRLPSEVGDVAAKWEAMRMIKARMYDSRHFLPDLICPFELRRVTSMRRGGSGRERARNGEPGEP